MIKNREELISNGGNKYGKARDDALYILEEVLKKMNGYNLVKSSLKVKGDSIFIKGRKINLMSHKRIFVIGFGKASASMAKAIEDLMDIDGGIVISTEDIKLKKIEMVKGSHPFPEKRNVDATQKIVELVEDADPDDLIIVLISGGGSSLLCLPHVSLDAMKEVSAELMKRGCTIEELNAVRKHISKVKGGQLAEMSRAKMISLIISDIIGNPVDAIASGPTAGDPTTFRDAMKILRKYNIRNEEVVDFISEGIKGKRKETPSKLENVENIIIGDINMACHHALEMAGEKGYDARIISTSISGEAREMGKNLVEYAIFHPRRNIVFISGGETTVNVKGDGKGGRNQEMVLSAIENMTNEAMVFLSCGTDGMDGNSPAAGAIADGGSYARARKRGLNLEEYLNNNDSYEFFKKMGDAIFTGYTGTNVMDLQIMVKI